MYHRYKKKKRKRGLYNKTRHLTDRGSKKERIKRSRGEGGCDGGEETMGVEKGRKRRSYATTPRPPPPLGSRGSENQFLTCLGAAASGGGSNRVSIEQQSGFNPHPPPFAHPPPTLQISHLRGHT
jgi:hypothetical protein